MSEELQELLKAFWPELIEADCQRNAGMSVELFSVEIYARQVGVTREQYIIAVLRAERDRRQEVDRIASDKALLDGEIDAAAAAGMSVLDYVAGKLTHPRFPSILYDADTVVRPVDLSKDFVLNLVRRLEERAVTCSPGRDGQIPEEEGDN